MSATNKLDLHHYDGRITISVKLTEQINRVSQLTAETKLAAFQQLAKKLPPTAIHCYNIILNEFMYSGRSHNKNYDYSNDLHACDLLYLCYEEICIKNNQELLNELILQLIDMSTGACEPGRTTRLYQLITAFLQL